LLVIDVSASLLHVGLLAALLTQQALTASTAYAALGLSAAVACFVWWRTACLPVRFQRTQIGADWRHNWSFGRWALTGHLLGSSMSQLIPWLLASLDESGASATGLFAASISLVGLTNVVAIGMSNLLSPRAARTYGAQGVHELRRLLARFALFYLALLGGFCLLVAFSGDWLVRLVYGERFAGSAAILLLLAINALVNSFGITAGNGLWAIDRPRANFAADACLMVAALVAAVCLIPSYGATGAAAAMLIGSSIAALVRFATLRQALHGLQQARFAPGGETA
jgi:O-antigen/teichoic acid export membrane protein